MLLWEEDKGRRISITRIVPLCNSLRCLYYDFLCIVCEINSSYSFCCIFSKLCTYITEIAGLGGSVGCAIRLQTRRSRVQPSPRSATFFRGDWSWNIFYGHWVDWAVKPQHKQTYYRNSEVHIEFVAKKYFLTKWQGF